jgi:peptidoglycan-N-acetylglucosamine deacetylase
MSTSRAWILFWTLHGAGLAAGLLISWKAAVAILIPSHLLLIGTSFFSQFSLWGHEQRRFRATTREIHLTIDDGPGSDTMELLALLRDTNVTATFFLIGARVEAAPHLARAIAEDGHAIGNHTQTHPSAWFWSYLPHALRREIGHAQSAIHKATGHLPAYFRAPAGFRNLFTHGVLHEFNLGYMGWSARGFDTHETDPARILARMRHTLQPGGILLLHQGMTHHRATLHHVITTLQAEGWIFVCPKDLTA